MLGAQRDFFIFNLLRSKGTKADKRRHAAACTKEGNGKRGRGEGKEGGFERVGCNHQDYRATGRSMGSTGNKGGRECVGGGTGSLSPAFSVGG